MPTCHAYAYVLSNTSIVCDLESSKPINEYGNTKAKTVKIAQGNN